MAYVKDLMHTHLVAVSKSASIGSALRLMKHAHVSVLPVVEGHRLYGVLTRQDIENEKEDFRVSDFRLRRLFIESMDRPEKAAKIMVENKINRLPVVNNADDMKCVGIITSTEIARLHKKSIF